jgi:hypothetical protein
MIEMIMRDKDYVCIILSLVFIGQLVRIDINDSLPVVIIGSYYSEAVMTCPRNLKAFVFQQLESM